VLHFAGRPLRQMPVHVAHDFTHMGDVLVRVATLFRAQQLDVSATGLVANGFAAFVVPLAYRLGLVGLKPLLQRLGRHVDAHAKSLDYLFVFCVHDFNSPRSLEYDL
jgi:hypothetical protein